MQDDPANFGELAESLHSEKRERKIIQLLRVYTFVNTHRSSNHSIVVAL